MNLMQTVQDYALVLDEDGDLDARIAAARRLLASGEAQMMDGPALDAARDLVALADNPVR